MICPICHRKFESEEALKKHLEECKTIEQVKKEMNMDLKLDSSGCLF
ncbi:MAG: hypothetical protein NZ872_06380 [Archaeoglobaceae archaeon]|nr:hypothetical protein [Archaeoglobaceae archaeon]MDW8128825.1 hypothetical protein [Archaeoglobaceae archaeon]